MPRLSKKAESPQAAADTLEVIHHEVPETAAGAGASAIPAPRTEAIIGTTSESPPAAAAMPTGTTAPATAATTGNAATTGTGMTWRTMLHAVTLTEAAGMTVLLVATMLYGLSFFAPIAVAIVLFAGGALWMRKKNKAGAVYSLVVCSLTLVMFGGLFFGWSGFRYPQSWFETSFATLTVLVPVAGIAAGIATLRHKDGDDAARTPSIVVAALATIAVVVGIIGTLMADSAVLLPGDKAVTASNMAFEQKAITAGAGDVAIYFENKDPMVHNVKIEGHGESAIATGRQSVRHVFRNLTAGTYEYFCEIHPDMKGTLTVT